MQPISDEDTSDPPHRAIALNASRAAFRIAVLFLRAVVLSLGAYADDEFHNATLVTLPNGSRVLDVNWAIGTPTNVRILRIPAAYLGPFMGEGFCHPFGPSVDPDCQQNFTLTALLRMTLPDAGAPSTTDDSSAGIALVKLTSTVRASDPTGVSLVSSIIARHLDEVRATTPRLRVLPSVRGLQGFGLGNEIDPAGGRLWLYSDIYFDGASPATSTVDVECSNPEDDRRFDVHSPTGDDAICVEYFALPELSAAVEVNMTRRYLEDWQKIRANTAEVITNFLQT
jgi:hypothetical protein